MPKARVSKRINPFTGIEEYYISHEEEQGDVILEETLKVSNEELDEMNKIADIDELDEIREEEQEDEGKTDLRFLEATVNALKDKLIEPERMYKDELMEQYRDEELEKMYQKVSENPQLYSDEQIEATMSAYAQLCKKRQKERDKIDAMRYSLLAEQHDITEVQNPSHYDYKIKPWDAIKAWDLDFDLGSAVKYISRAGHKNGESKKKDLCKAIDFLYHEIDNL